MFIRASFFIVSFFACSVLVAQGPWSDFSTNADYAFVEPTTTSVEVEEIVAEAPSVVLNRFERSLMGTTTLLVWESDKETGNAYFLVQRSLDGGKNYETIGEINSADTPSEYIYLDDEKGNAQTMYRLAQVGLDGKVFFFNEM